MKPLLFLTFSQMRNSIRRSLTSVRRLVALLLVAAYYYYFLTSIVDRPNGALSKDISVQFPVEVASSIVFYIAILSTLLLLGMVGVQRGGFRPADVDVLFPTPIAPRVIVFFRIVRENFVVLVYPLLFVLVSGVGIAALAGALFKDLPNKEALSWLPYTAVLAWLLLQMLWVVAAHAFSLTTAGEATPAWVRRAPAVTSATAFLLLHLYLYWLGVSSGWSMRAFLEAGTAGPLRWIFFPASGATEIALAPLTGHYALGAIAGIGYLVGISALLALAFRHAHALYEQAALAVAASQPSETATRTGDMMQYYSDLARRGKLKGKAARFFMRLRWQGTKAILWRDLVVWDRLSGAWNRHALLGVVLVTAFLSVFARDAAALIEVFHFFCSIGAGLALVFGSWFAARTGWIDLLRKIDVNKSLPFNIFTTLVAQSTVRNGIAVAWAVVFVAAAFLLKAPEPALFGHVVLPISVGFVLLVTPLTYAVSATVLIYLLLFPDIEDSAQRIIREALTLATMVLAGIPGIIVALSVFALAEGFWGAFVAASAGVVGGMLVNSAIAAILLLIAAELYANFNPTE